MRKLFDVTVWDGSRLVATAENIVAGDEQEAVKNGIKAIASRRHAKEIGPLYRHLFEPWKQPEVPDGIRVFVAGKQRGKLVIG